MEIKEIALSELIHYENNPRKNDHAVEAVAKSIKEFGFKVPIVIDGENVIIAGHTRAKAAEQLGLKKVPCIIADDLTPEQVRAFRIADNKTGEFAQWDMELLTMELAELEGMFMGFDDDEIEKILSLGFDYSPDEFGEDFIIPDGGKGEIVQKTFTLHEKQLQQIEGVLRIINDECGDGEMITFGNTNKNGNLLYMAVCKCHE